MVLKRPKEKATLGLECISFLLSATEVRYTRVHNVRKINRVENCIHSIHSKRKQTKDFKIFKIQSKTVFIVLTDQSEHLVPKESNSG